MHPVTEKPRSVERVMGWKAGITRFFLNVEILVVLQRVSFSFSKSNTAVTETAERNAETFWEPALSVIKGPPEAYQAERGCSCANLRLCNELGG